MEEEAFSSRYHRFESYDDGVALFAYLEDKLPPSALLFPSLTWSARASFGGLYINGKPALFDQSLPIPALVEYFEPKFDLKNASAFYPPFDPQWIVFEDEFLLVSFKPARLPTMPAKEQNQYSLRRYLDTYIGHEVHCPSRLDMSTQGLVLVSKHKHAHGPVQQLFEQKLVQKHYLLLSDISMTAEHWDTKLVDVPIGKTDRHPVLRVPNGKKSQSAQTFFVRRNSHRFMDRNDQEHCGCFYTAEPRTGRTHQIRVHSAFLGIPIVGDRFYGHIPHHPLCLLSWKVAFTHPLTKKFLEVLIPSSLIPEWACAADCFS